MVLHLVRHGAPAAQPGAPTSEWPLDAAAVPDVLALRSSGRLPETSAWYTSPEPKAVATAELLHGGQVGVVPELREQRRGAAPWFDDAGEWEGRVRAAFAYPGRAVVPGWEPLGQTRDRLLPAVRRLLERHVGEDLVLVGHGTAWTLLVAELTGTPPDLGRWQLMTMPDLLTVDPLDRPVASGSAQREGRRLGT